MENVDGCTMRAMDFTKQVNLLLMLCTKATESKLVKLATSHQVILPPEPREYSLIQQVPL